MTSSKYGGACQGIAQKVWVQRQVAGHPLGKDPSSVALLNS